jgi:hypothetical protein
VLALVRSAAYLQNGDAQQATRDARFALAYGPKRPDAPPVARPAPAADAPAKAGGKGGGKGDNPPEEEPELPPLALAGRDSAWPAALRTLSSALEAAADNVPAALAAARAAELLQAAQRDPGAAGEALQRLLRRVPEPVADVLRVSAALQPPGYQPACLPACLRMAKTGSLWSPLGESMRGASTAPAGHLKLHELAGTCAFTPLSEPPGHAGGRRRRAGGRVTC